MSIHIQLLERIIILEDVHTHLISADTPYRGCNINDIRMNRAVGPLSNVTTCTRDCRITHRIGNTPMIHTPATRDIHGSPVKAHKVDIHRVTRAENRLIMTIIQLSLGGDKLLI